MSKAALEKKKFSRKDREVTDYYIEDYVYISNFKTRIFVLMIIGGLIGGQMMLKIQTGLNIPTTVKEWLYEYIIPYGTIIVAFLVIYTFISTWIYTYKYNDAQKKKKNYERALTELKKHQE